jgi:hypothetical protein
MGRLEIQAQSLLCLQSTKEKYLIFFSFFFFFFFKKKKNHLLLDEEYEQGSIKAAWMQNASRNENYNIYIYIYIYIYDMTQCTLLDVK